MSVPASRSLPVVLRALTQGRDEGASLVVAADTAGGVAYLIGSPGRLLYLGSVTDQIDVVVEGEAVPGVPRLAAGGGAVGPPGPEGPQGEPGVMEIYEQPDDPPDESVGAVWIDTDAPDPGPVVVTGPPLVTSLPSTPYDGQEVYYLASATDGVAWHLRYRAATAGAYRWSFVGGAELAVYNDTTAGPLPDSQWVDLATGAITAPLAGRYTIRWGAYLSLTVGALSMAGSTRILQGASTEVGQASIFVEGGMPDLYAPVATERPVDVTAGTVLKLQGWNQGGQVTFARRYVALRPLVVG